MVVNLLVVGNSETEIFHTERRMLQEEFSIEAQVEYRSGCRLEECLPLIQTHMNENTNMIFIWALTSWAWKEMSINNGNMTATVFKPDNLFSLSEVPTLMNKITEYVLTVNSDCKIFLVIPGVHDFYSFNQTQLEKAWGPSSKDFLEKHPILNPVNMRDHSIHIYQTFESLTSTEYTWNNKNLILAIHVINIFFSRHSRRRLLKGKRPPHATYLSKSSLKLNLHLIPDGLHGNQEFLKFFMLRFKKLFEVCSEFEKSGQRDSLPATKTEKPPRPRPSKVSRYRFLAEDSLEKVSKKRKASSSFSKSRPFNNGRTIGAKRKTGVLCQFQDLQQPSTSCVGSPPTSINNDPQSGKDFSFHSLPYSNSPPFGSQPPAYMDLQPPYSSSDYQSFDGNVPFNSFTEQPVTYNHLTKFPESLTPS
ncbi:UNVERIFIED_CONTAM: hypothetical protein RMT77_015051 [Armadillidium vulgare]